MFFILVQLLKEIKHLLRQSLCRVRLLISHISQRAMCLRRDKCLYVHRWRAMSGAISRKWQEKCSKSINVLLCLVGICSGFNWQSEEWDYKKILRLGRERTGLWLTRHMLKGWLFLFGPMLHPPWIQKQILM